MNKKQIIDYIKSNDFDVQSARAAFCPIELAYDAYTNLCSKAGADFSPILSMVDENNLFSQVIAKKVIMNVSRTFYQDFLRDPDAFRKRLDSSAEIDRKIFELWNRKLVSSMSEAELASFYAELISLAGSWWSIGAIGEDKGEFMSLDAIPDFAKNHGLELEKAKFLFFILAHPDSKARYVLERRSLLEICLRILKKDLKESLLKQDYDTVMKDSKLGSMVEAHAKEYFWFKTNFYQAVEMTPNTVLLMASAEMGKEKKDFMAELKVSDRNFKEVHSQKKRAAKQFKLSDKEKLQLEYATLMAEWLDARKMWMMRQFYVLLLTLRHISERKNIPYDKLGDYSMFEIKDLLENGKTLSKQELAKRKKSFLAFFQKGKKTILFYGDEAKKLYELTQGKESEEVRGTVASLGKGNPGKLTGIASIIFHPESEPFREGDILVTSMTRVEFVPLMRKAKAIITDEGGVACHAAIVSRELGIPCIIGTKTATKRLQSGDLIEIDIEKGTVKKLRGDGYVFVKPKDKR